MKFKVQASAEDIAKAGQDQGDFEVPKPGYYFLKIVEANGGYSKMKDSEEEDKTKPRVEIVYEVVGEGMQNAKPTANYGRIWDYITFGDGYAATRRVEITKALHPNVSDADIEAGKVELDTDEMMERIVVARLKHEKDKRKSEEEKKTINRARVAMVMSVDSVDGYTVTEHSGDAFGSAAEEADPFAEPEPEGSVEEEEEVGALLTAEELASYDMKELGATAKEFDLDPGSFVVKKDGKTDLDASKEAIISGILEAQGGNEEEDDNPF